jgi:hypothetical protein
LQRFESWVIGLFFLLVYLIGQNTPGWYGVEIDWTWLDMLFLTTGWSPS